ncbi:MAG: ATP-binding protein [Pseudomonadota bacterium]
MRENPISNPGQNILVVTSNSESALAQQIASSVVEKDGGSADVCSREGLAAALEVRRDCVLLVEEAVDYVDAETVKALAIAISPTPVMIVGPGASQHEQRLLPCGIDDCLDTDIMPSIAIARAASRCIERSRERVHVSTAQKRYDALFDDMPVAAFKVDSVGQIILGNKSFLSLMQVNDKSSVTDIELNGLLAGLRALQNATAGEMPEYRNQHIVVTPDGEQKHVIVSARASGNKDAPGLDVFMTDVTEQEQQTRRIVKAENRLRDLYDNVPTMLFEIDHSGRIQHPNRTMQAVFGLDEAALEGKTLASLAADAIHENVCVKSHEVVMTGTSVSEQPLNLKHSGGDVIECLLTVMVGRDADGAVRLGHAMLVDVTSQNRANRERDALEEQLQLSQKLDSIGELAAGIAHEINTPAQYVSDNLSFLLESFDDLFGVLKLLTPADDQESAPALDRDKLKAAMDAADLEFLIDEIPSALDQGRDGIGKIREIVLALKDFSHPGSGVMEPADLNRLIESTVTVARNEWKYIAEVHMQLDESLPPVTCFSSAVSQVVLNIVVNAAHAIADSVSGTAEQLGNITISTCVVDDDLALIEIADDGPGMPDSVRQKIFDPFFTTKEVGRGTGQGLAISRRVVTEQHGGTIEVETDEGVGTIFRIRLPISGGTERDGISEAAA